MKRVYSSPPTKLLWQINQIQQPNTWYLDNQPFGSNLGITYPNYKHQYPWTQLSSHKMKTSNWVTVHHKLPTKKEPYRLEATIYIPCTKRDKGISHLSGAHWRSKTSKGMEWTFWRLKTPNSRIHFCANIEHCLENKSECFRASVYFTGNWCQRQTQLKERNICFLYKEEWFQLFGQFSLYKEHESLWTTTTS